jgi:long-chain acyl-CoA synthetase
MTMPAGNLLTMATAIRRAKELYGDRTAILDREGNMTWSEYTGRITRAAGVLAELGLEQGQRFGILAHNSFRQAELIHGGYWSGIVPVPVNYRLAAPEIRYILDDADCRLLVVDEHCAGLLEHPDLAPWRERALFISPQAGEDHPWPRYEELMTQASPAPMHVSTQEDDAILLYTGGTTGRSKGVPLTHGNIISNGMQVGLAYLVYEDDRFLHSLPMFHSADLIGTAFTLTGAAHAYLGEFSPKAMLQMIQDHRITMLSLGPTVIILTLQDPDFDKYDISSVRRMNYGSAPMAMEWVVRTMEKFTNVAMQQTYGLTETSPILTTLTPEQHQLALDSGRHELLRSVGKPLVHVDLRIVDEDGNEVDAGEVGEVVVRGPNVTRGYLGLDQENARAFRNGWFHTGDMGYLDEQSNLFLADRKKDMIITGGENVYCAEVEGALYKYPGVHEAAVFGVPDQKWGEAVFAAIVPAPGEQLDKDAIIDHCRQYIGGYKIPRRMAFIDALPKSAMGKVLKHELRRRYSEERRD